MKIEMIKSLIIGFTCTSLIFGSLDLSAQCHPDDFEALRQLYLNTDGDNWDNNSGWELVRDNASPPSGCDLSTLSGVFGFDTNGRVTDIGLSYNGLSGPIPPEIGLLTQLEHFAPEGNQLSGGIPSELYELTNLEGIFLVDNQLSGTISSDIVNLTSLERLNLAANQLEGTIPREIGNLDQLELLRLNNNMLTGGIPPELGNLNLLFSLRLSDNQLTGCLHPHLANVCSAGSNSYITIGNSLDGKWENFCNPTTNTPKSGPLTGNCLDCSAGGGSNAERKALEDLYVNTNGLNWKKNDGWLFKCDPCGYNGGSPWYGVTCDNDKLRVEKLELVSNLLTGSINNSLEDLLGLKTLNLQDNTLNGVIPFTLGNLSNLEYLNLNNNMLAGIIPTQLGDLQKLIELNLSFNSLSSSLPFNLGYLDSLTHLRLNNNSLTGAIPTDLENLTKLKYLNLRGNQLAGSIPDIFGSFQSLTHVYLYDNLLSGNIPASLGHVPNLSVLDLSNNNLSGCIHQDLLNFCNVPITTSVDISDNPYLLSDSWSAICTIGVAQCYPNSYCSSLDTFTYESSIDNNWFNPLNWDSNQVPSACTNAIIPQNKFVDIFPGFQGKAYTLDVKDGAQFNVHLLGQLEVQN